MKNVRSVPFRGFRWQPRVLLITSLLFACAICKVSAQQAAVEKVPLPAPPFVNQAPEFSAWVVHFDPAGNPQTGAQKPRTNVHTIKEIDVTKTREFRREVTVYTDGTTGEFWRYGGLEIMQDPIGKYVNILNPAKTQMAAVNPTKTDFFDVGWIRANDFVGKVAVSGHDCYYFKRAASTSGATADPMLEDAEQTAYGHRSLEAWIDMSTRLPVAFRDEHGLRQYEFGAAPTAMLTLPAIMQKELDRYQAALHDGDKYALPPHR